MYIYTFWHTSVVRVLLHPVSARGLGAGGATGIFTIATCLPLAATIAGKAVTWTEDDVTTARSWTTQIWTTNIACRSWRCSLQTLGGVARSDCLSPQATLVLQEHWPSEESASHPVMSQCSVGGDVAAFEGKADEEIVEVDVEGPSGPHAVHCVGCWEVLPSNPVCMLLKPERMLSILTLNA